MGRPRKNPILTDDTKQILNNNKNMELSNSPQISGLETALVIKTPDEEKIKQIPPILFNRNRYGLFSHIEYKFKENGKIDWFKMAPEGGVYIKPLKLAQKEELEQKTGKLLHEIHPILDNVEEKYLAITLAALRILCKNRGFNALRIKTDIANPEYASVSCSIDWLPNYETENRPITYEANASVALQTANDFTKNYLVETAANRAESRAIRNFLEITCVSAAELLANNVSPPEDNFEPSNASDPKNILNKKMKDLGISSIEILKEKLEKIGDVSYAEYNSFKDIPKDRYFSLIGLLSKLS